MQALFTRYQTRSDRLQRYRQLLAGLRAVTSNAEQDDVPVMVEIDGMKFWVTGELEGLIGNGSPGLTYEVSPGCAACACSTHSSSSRIPWRWGWPALNLCVVQLLLMWGEVTIALVSTLYASIFTCCYICQQQRRASTSNCATSQQHSRSTCQNTAGILTHISLLQTSPAGCSSRCAPPCAGLRHHSNAPAAAVDQQALCPARLFCCTKAAHSDRAELRGGSMGGNL
jgi:hypothetical protein